MKSYAAIWKGTPKEELPSHVIDKWYGNKEGTFLLYVDGSKGWLDPETGTMFQFISTP